jgi:hypothetical protein
VCELKSGGEQREKSKHMRRYIHTTHSTGCIYVCIVKKKDGEKYLGAKSIPYLIWKRGNKIRKEMRRTTQRKESFL